MGIIIRFAIAGAVAIGLLYLDAILDGNAEIDVVVIPQQQIKTVSI